MEVIELLVAFEYPPLLVFDPEVHVVDVVGVSEEAGGNPHIHKHGRQLLHRQKLTPWQGSSQYINLIPQMVNSPLLIQVIRMQLFIQLQQLRMQTTHGHQLRIIRSDRLRSVFGQLGCHVQFLLGSQSVQVCGFCLEVLDVN